MQFTKTSVAAIKIPAGKADHIAWDAKLPGFGVRVNSGGKRSWIIQARLNGQSMRMTLGTTEKMDPDKARRAAKIALGKIEQGIDPRDEKAERVAAAGVTFARQRGAYLDYARERTKPRTMEEIERAMTDHWSTLDKKPLASITRADIAARLIEIKTERGPYAANRARAYVSSFFSWAMREGLIEANPVIGTNKPIEEKSRDRVLDNAELVAIWKAAGDAGHYGRIVRLLLLTGQRRDEIARLAWSEVDLAGRVLNLPPERTKNGRAHDLPLSDDAAAILAAIDHDDGRAFVFGRFRKDPEQATGFSGFGKGKAELDETLGAKVKPWRLHDLRRTVATGMAEIGIPPHIIEAVLNHVSGHKGGIAGVYNKAVYAAEKRQALDRWAAHVAALVAGNASNVVALRKA